MFGGRILFGFLSEAGDAEAFATNLSLDFDMFGRSKFGECAINEDGLFFLCLLAGVTIEGEATLWTIAEDWDAMCAANKLSC